MSDVIAWNPGVELSCSMADMPNDGYKTMVCVETGRVSKPLIAAGEQPARLAVTFPHPQERVIAAGAVKTPALHHCTTDVQKGRQRPFMMPALHFFYAFAF
jgi:hypothetical protein